MYTFFISYSFALNIIIDAKIVGISTFNGSSTINLSYNMEDKEFFGICEKVIIDALKKSLYEKNGKNFHQNSVVILNFKRLL